MTETLVQQMWGLLDAEMEVISATPVGSERDVPKARARAFAEVLAIFMVPHFKTADDIAREAGRRFKAKKSGTEYETPGLNSRKV